VWGAAACILACVYWRHKGVAPVLLNHLWQHVMSVLTCLSPGHVKVSVIEVM